jgi:hypothetical protein
MILLLAVWTYSGLFMFMLELELRDSVGGLEGAFTFVFRGFSGLCSILEEGWRWRWAVPRAQCA